METLYGTVQAEQAIGLPIDIDPTFMAQILKPYKEHTTYLKSASIIHYGKTEDNNAENQNLVVAKGEFSIPESCYIDDTGHFNSVEFNICYNQLAYVMFAYCIKEGIIQKVYPDWIKKVKLPYDLFLKKQLSSMLIVKIEGKFLKPQNAKKFWGEVSLERVSPGSKASFAYTDVKYYDEEGVKSKGSVLIAFSTLQ